MTAPAELTAPASETDRLRHDVLAGLRARPKTLPSKYFYDAEGSRLFDRITELDAYYPTRTEAGILDHRGDEVAAFVMGASDARAGRPVLVEYGSGSSEKTRLLLDRLPALAAYVPLDISREHLLATADRLREAYPGLRVEPVVADYTGPLHLPDLDGPRVLFFPGSTIGNFTPGEAVGFLARMAETAGPGGRLVIGVDLRKDRVTLERAYDDPEGVTAAFNRNLLVRLNRELGATFDPAAFDHRAVWNPVGEGGASGREGRVEMHLVARWAHTVMVAGEPVRFGAGESIHTENSYKYTPRSFAALAARAGWHVAHVWTDDAGLFSVQALVVR